MFFGALSVARAVPLRLLKQIAEVTIPIRVVGTHHLDDDAVIPAARTHECPDGLGVSADKFSGDPVRRIFRGYQDGPHPEIRAGLSARDAESHHGTDARTFSIVAAQRYFVSQLMPVAPWHGVGGG